MVRVAITLACTDCKQRNYQTTKDKKKTTEKMEVRKSCKGIGLVPLPTNPVTPGVWCTADQDSSSIIMLTIT